MANSKDKSSNKRKDDGKKPEESADSFGDKIRLTNANALLTRAGGAGVVLLAIAVGLGASKGDGFSQFFHSYLTAFMWALAITLGALWWVTLQHLVNAKWSVAVRRVAELLAGNMILMAALAVPIIAEMADGHSLLYRWINHAEVEKSHLLEHKAPYLNFGFFALRCVVYFVFWTALARFFLLRSVKQDQTGGQALTDRMRAVSAPGMIAVALTLTFAAFDFLMSLDPEWFSTIFGVYYFAGCVSSVNSALVLTLMYLQSQGVMKKSITTEHFHDLGKMMFGFVVFWSYIAFSQFMLIYYANIPEETAWYKHRLNGEWATASIVLVVGHFAIPFFGLLSRWVKRSRPGLAFWAVYLLVIEYVDLYWLIQPNIHHEGPAFGVIDIACWLGMACLLVAGAAFSARGKNLVPIKDPRIEKSLAFENL